MAASLAAKPIVLESTSETVHNGIISRDIKPVLTVKSGGAVTIAVSGHSGGAAGD
jgi:hypothetical protein